MSEAYNEWFEEFEEAAALLDKDEVYASLSSLLHESRNTFALNRKLMQKIIDVSWVETIENALIHVDNCLRNPRRTIEDVEEIVPIALSRKITVESVKHLAQHTDYIQSYDKRTGKITPSKILNVHKEESLMTYENKFVNTLVDRLYIFINRRYEKLAQVAKDEQAFTLGYDTVVDDGNGGHFKVEMKIESASSLAAYDASGYTVWQRVEKLKKAIEGYKGSDLCMQLGNNYIRPPVMRTNAIMKNVDLKACLTLWQYIESYDKVGYEINIEDNAVQPTGTFVENFYRMVILQMLLFRSQMEGSESLAPLRTKKNRKFRVIQPKFIKKFDKELSGDYDVTVSGAAGYLAAEGEQQFVRKMPEDVALVFDQVAAAIQVESAYQEELERKRIADRIAAEEEERHRAEQERIEAARQAELQRIEEERAEEARRLEQMLAQKRAEQEAAERERERIEQERIALIEAKRKREEEERLRREEQERIDAERERLANEKQLVRSELGGAEGLEEDVLAARPDDLDETTITVSDEEIEEVKASMSEENEFEDPREIAARNKLEQQKRDKERKEAERAERLKAERTYFQNKPFREIRKEYTKNPFYAIPRLIRHLLAILFGIVPEDTDNPDYKVIRAERLAEKERKAAVKAERDKMEVYYRKYAPLFPYSFLRKIEDAKFKRKRAKDRKKNPPKPYKPPVRTPEEQEAIRTEMQRLYRTYHVSHLERMKRKMEDWRRRGEAA